MRPNSVREIWCSYFNSGFLVDVVEFYFFFIRWGAFKEASVDVVV